MTAIQVKLNLLGVLSLKQDELLLDTPQSTTLEALIEMIDWHNPGFRCAVLEQDRSISPQFVFFVNGRNALHLKGKDTELNAGDVVNVIPAIAGG